MCILNVVCYTFRAMFYLTINERLPNYGRQQICCCYGPPKKQSITGVSITAPNLLIIFQELILQGFKFLISFFLYGLQLSFFLLERRSKKVHAMPA